VDIFVVTGGAGFIGLNIVNRLAANDTKVLIVDNHSKGWNEEGLESTLKRFPSLVSEYSGDVADYEFLKSVVKHPIDIGHKIKIIHCAAMSHVDRSIKSPLDCLQSNTVGTANILELTRTNRDNVETVVVSTDEVYGDEGPFPTPWGWDLKPSSPYSATKAAGDLLVYAYRRTYGLPVRLSRCCNNFGKYQNGEKFIPTVIKAISEGKPIPVYGNGLQQRQWVPVDEHARRLICSFLSTHLDLQVGGVSMPNLDLINLIAGIIGKPANIDFIQDRPGHDVKYELADADKIDYMQFVDCMTQYVKRSISYAGN